MKILANSWLMTAAFAVAIVGSTGNRASAELIHEWGFEETIGTGPVDTDGGPDTFSQNLNLVNGGTQVSNAGTGAPIGLGGQSFKAGNGDAATVGGQKASVFSAAGVPGIGFKGFAAGTASVWVYRTADQIVGNNSSTIFTIERDGSAGAAGRASVQIVMPGTGGAAPPAARGVVGSITVSGREGPAGSTRMTYNTTAAQGNLVPLNTWTNIVAVWDYANGDPDGDANPDPDSDGLFGGTMLLYVNGLPITGGTYASFWPDDGTGDTNTLTALDSNGLVVGTGNSDPANSNNQEELEGLVDGFRLYNTGLNEIEVLALYRSYFVPEPSSFVLFALGMLAYAGRRRAA